MLTSKNYKAIAHIIRINVGLDNKTIQCWNLTQDLCIYFEKENARFNSDKFISDIINAPDKSIAR
jgi:hypothetical protein